MAILNRDGSVFALRGPNPLMLTQDDWDRSKVTLINMSLKQDVVKDEASPPPDVPDVAEVLAEGTRTVSAAEFVGEVVIEAAPQVARMIKQRSVEYYCAPAVGVKTHVDELYGDSYDTPVYGEQYLFDAVVIDASDLQIQVWCATPVSVNSVIYRKSGQGGERWWRVASSEPRSGGYLLTASVSNVNPDFS